MPKAVLVSIETDEMIALRRFMNEYGISVPEIAARIVLRDWLIERGYLEPEHVLDEDTETVGEA